MGTWMHWLLTTHVRRYKRHYHSSGHIWQGRFKAFPVQEDDHLRVVLRYIERNALRAALVERAEDWPWSSLHGASAGVTALIRLDAGPAPRGDGWVEASILPCLRLRSLGSGSPSVVTARWETRSGRWRPRSSWAWNTVSTHGADRQSLIATDTAPAEARCLSPKVGR
jgi:hypothetical protein